MKRMRDIGFAFALVLTGCVSVPPGPPPEIARLESELARLHDDPRIAPNAEPELGNADAAVDTLARDGRRLDEPTFRHGVYLADRLIQIAEASGLARYEERRGQDLGAERERLLAREPRRLERAYTPANGVAYDSLAAIQARLGGVESHLSGDGLVVTFGDFMFDSDRETLREPARNALDALAAALRDEPARNVSIDGHADAGGRRAADLAALRSASVRDYLLGQGVDANRLDTRRGSAGGHATGPSRAVVEIVVR
ncbi:MAG: OmpA family protein [Lysobacterales bacterium]|jgi:outer membrane protein OmpA-like peptidoglycan-associated protein